MEIILTSLISYLMGSIPIGFLLTRIFLKKDIIVLDNALESIKNLINKKKTFDLIFIDADKENYINYYNLSYQLLNKCGLLLIDNVLWKGEVSNSDKNDRLTTVIKNFNSFVKEDERVEKTILPLGDGLTICKKI